MFIYKKTPGRLDVYKVTPNMDKIIEVREQEIYGQLEYLKIYEAATNMPEDFLLMERDQKDIDRGLNIFIDEHFICFYHKFYPQQVTEDEAFSYLRRVIETPVMPCVEATKLGGTCYYAMTEPYYFNDESMVFNHDDPNYREMKGIVPITKTMYEINELIKVTNAGNFNSFKDNLESYAKYSDLFDIEYVRSISLLNIKLEELYESQAVDGSYNDFESKINVSNELLRRVRTTK